MSSYGTGTYGSGTYGVDAAAHPVATIEIDFTTSLSAGAAYHEQVFPSAPYGYWRLKETSGTFVDATGNGHTGTPAGTVTYNQTTTPVTGDTTSRNINLTTDTTEFDFVGAIPAGNQLTLETFVYVTDLSKSRFIFENDGTTSAFNTSLAEVWIGTNGSLNAKAVDGSATVATAAGEIVINTWYHVVVIFDGPKQEIRFSKNGTFVSGGTWRTSRLATPSLAKLQLTWRWGTDSSSSRGSIARLAEPAVYLRALTTTEISDHYLAIAVVPFAGFTWTDVTQYVLFGDGIKRTFGRASELDDVVPMQTEYTLINDDRRFEFGNSGENIVANDGIEVNTAGYAGGNGATISRVTSEQYAGVASLQVVAPGAVVNEYVGYSLGTLASGQVYAAQARVKAPVGTRLYMNLLESAAARIDFVADGTWQLIEAPDNTGTGIGGNLYIATDTTGPAQAVTFYVDDVQVLTGAPYYPYIVPGRPTRIRMTHGGTTYDWAFGFIEDWPQEWDAAGMFCRVPIRASCFLARLGEEDIGARDFAEQLAGNRLTVLLNAAGLPTSMRDVDVGANTVMALASDTQTVGVHAKAAQRSDRGLLYFDGRGYAVFHDGDRRTTHTRSTVSQGTLGDEPGEIPFRSPVFSAPLEFVRNDITLRRPGGVDQTVSDQTSKNRYGKRSYSDELLLTTDVAVATRAADLLAFYKEPRTRIRAITFNPAVPPGFWEHALGVQPSDRYTHEFRPAQGASITRDVFVEGVTDHYTNRVYTATWFLSTA